MDLSYPLGRSGGTIYFLALNLLPDRRKETPNKAMTPRELAEKIVEKGQEISDDGGSSRRMINWLESFLAEAMEEVRKEEQIAWEEANTELVKEAKAAAYEDAAKIAENTPLNILRSQGHEGLRLSISDAIRQRAKEIK